MAVIHLEGYTSDYLLIGTISPLNVSSPSPTPPLLSYLKSIINNAPSNNNASAAELTEGEACRIGWRKKEEKNEKKKKDQRERKIHRGQIQSGCAPLTMPERSPSPLGSLKSRVQERQKTKSQVGRGGTVGVKKINNKKMARCITRMAGNKSVTASHGRQMRGGRVIYYI